MKHLNYEYTQNHFGYSILLPNKPKVKKSGVFTKVLHVESQTETENYGIYTLASKKSVEKSYISFVSSFIGSLRQSMNGRLSIDEDYRYLGLPAVSIKCTSDNATVFSLVFHTDRYVYLISMRQNVEGNQNFKSFIKGFKFL